MYFNLLFESSTTIYNSHHYMSDCDDSVNNFKLFQTYNLIRLSKVNHIISKYILKCLKCGEICNVNNNVYDKNGFILIYIYIHLAHFFY